MKVLNATKEHLENLLGDKHREIRVRAMKRLESNDYRE